MSYKSKYTGPQIDELLDAISNAARPYKVYSALLTQSGTSAPTVIVSENTIGNVSYQRYRVGQYGIVFSDYSNVVANKVWVLPSTNSTVYYDNSGSASKIIQAYFNNNTVYIDTYLFDSFTNLLWNSTEANFVKLPIEIRIYP